MTRSHAPRPFGVIPLAACLAGAAAGAALTLALLVPFRPPTAAADDPEPPPAEQRLVVCVGHVDVEEGVLALAPVHAGRVVEVLVHDSAPVSAGAVLLRQDDQQARSQVRQAEAEVQAAEAQLAQLRGRPEQHAADLRAQQAAIQAAQARLAAARLTLRRKQSLQGKAWIDVSEVKVAEEAVNEATAVLAAEEHKLGKLQLLRPGEQVAQAEADVAARKARLEEARQVLAECSLCAPASGDVLRVLATRGEVLGGQASRPAVWFCPDQPRVVRAEVPQEFAGGIAAGQSCLIQDEAQLGETWRGQVARLSDWFTQRRSVLQEPLQRNDLRTLECLVRLEPGQRPVRIGQRMRVTVLR